MNITKIDFIVGDKDNGILSTFETEEEAQKEHDCFLDEFLPLRVEDLIMAAEDKGSPVDEEEILEQARKDVVNYFFIAKRTRVYDEDDYELSQHWDFL